MLVPKSSRIYLKPIVHVFFIICLTFMLVCEKEMPDRLRSGGPLQQQTHHMWG